MTLGGRVVGTACAALVGLCGIARADEPLDRPEGFEVDRDAPPPGQVEFSFDGGQRIDPATPAKPGSLHSGGWAVSLQLGFLDRPMRLHTTKVKIFPVEQRETLAFGGAWQLTPTFLVDARMPISHQTGDRYMGLGDQRPLDRWVANDLGLGARLQLAARDTFGLFVRGELTLGTGNDFQFAGEARYTMAGMLIGRMTAVDRLVVAGTLGARFRGREVIVADRLLGNELFGAIGATYRLPALPGLYCDANDVRITAELDGVLGDDVGMYEGASPAELRLGIVGRVRRWLALGVHAGKGIDDQIGAPRSRVMLEAAFVGGAL